ncbi:Uncharacterised protein [Mycobacterium tuberculosis]|nr:Uncharacterised protein [Mycobacterium tuberculosis]
MNIDPFFRQFYIQELPIFNQEQGPMTLNNFQVSSHFLIKHIYHKGEQTVGRTIA